MTAQPEYAWESTGEPEHVVYRVKVEWETTTTYRHIFEVKSDDVRATLGLDPDEPLDDEMVIDWLCEGEELSEASEWARETDSDIEVGETEVIEKRVLSGETFDNPMQAELPLTEEG